VEAAPTNGGSRKQIGLTGMRATLIFANYDGRELLERCVPAALAAAKAAGDHVVAVADDGSTDDSIHYLSTVHPEVEVMAFPHRGFGATCNAAVEAAQTEVVALLNNDMVVAPDFLSPLLEDLAADDVFAVGCKFVNPDGSLTDTLGNRTSCEWQRGLLSIHHETDPARLAETCPQLYANGGGLAFRREKWLALGGFDPLYHPFYWEDVDLGYRAWGRGWRVLYEPRSVVSHEHGSTTQRTHSREYVELVSARNAVLFVWKNVLDRKLLLRSLCAQARWAADDVLIGGLPPRTRALSAALQKLPEAARGRLREQRERVKTDAEILAAGGAGG
jgi:GT2 family glycosyltransferase